METQKEKLGKVSITVEEDYWNVNKVYKKLTIVERQSTGTTYLSRKPVPAGTSISNRKYWIKFSKWSDIPYEITQEFGDSTELVISQKVVTLKINELQGFINNINEIIGEGGSIDERFNNISNALDDRYTKEETYSKQQVNNLITTPDQQFVTVEATSQTTNVTDVLPNTGSSNTIYRVGNWNGTQYSPTVYSEYSWDGTNYIFLRNKDDSGDGVFDVSAKYPTSGVEEGNTYTLERALAILNTNLPASKKKGGMSIKFVQSSDNKYVQWRLMNNEWSTNVNNWQGVDDEPIAGSKNLVESNAINFNNKKLLGQIKGLTGVNASLVSLTEQWQIGYYDDIGLFNINSGKCISVASTKEHYYAIYTKGFAALTSIVALNSSDVIDTSGLLASVQRNVDDIYIIKATSSYIGVCCPVNFTSNVFVLDLGLNANLKDLINIVSDNVDYLSNVIKTSIGFIDSEFPNVGYYDDVGILKTGSGKNVSIELSQGDIIKAHIYINKNVTAVKVGSPNVIIGTYTDSSSYIWLDWQWEADTDCVLGLTTLNTTGSSYIVEPKDSLSKKVDKIENDLLVLHNNVKPITGEDGNSFPNTGYYDDMGRLQTGSGKNVSISMGKGDVIKAHIKINKNVTAVKVDNPNVVIGTYTDSSSSIWLDWEWTADEDCVLGLTTLDVNGATYTIFDDYSLKAAFERIDKLEENTYALESAYVSPNGDDSNDGSKNSPFKTINAAITSKRKRIIIAPATYIETISVSNREELQIICAPLPTYVAGGTTDKVIIDADDNNRVLSLINCKNILLEGIEFTNSYDNCVHIENCNNIVLKSCVAHDNQHTGYACGFKTINSFVDFYNCEAYDVRLDGFGLSGYGTQNLYNCSGHDCDDDGVSHHDACHGTIVGGEYYNNGKGGISSPCHGSTVNISGAYCHNNLYGLYCVSDNGLSSGIASNCCLVNNQNQDIVMDGTSQTKLTIFNVIYRTKYVGTNATLNEITA